MEVVLNILHIHLGNEHVISSVRIPIQGPEQYVPLLQDIQAGVEDMRPKLDPKDISLYWRVTNDRFVPIYDYLTFSGAWAQMAAPNLYLVVRDIECPSKVWEGARADEQHPIASFSGRAGDQRALALAFPAGVRGLYWEGNSREEAFVTHAVVDTLKGSPNTPKDELSKDDKGEKSTAGGSKKGDKGKKKGKGKGKGKGKSRSGTPGSSKRARTR